MADESPRLDLEMLDKLISKLDQVYVKALEVTDQLDKLSSKKFTIGFSQEFKNAAADLDRLLSVIKSFNRTNFKAMDGLFDFFQEISRISQLKVNNINTRAYNNIANIIERVADLINSTKVSLADANRLGKVMESFGKIMTTLSSVSSGRGIPVRQILLIQTVIKPIINVLKELVKLASSGLTVGRANSLNDVIESFGRTIQTISNVFQDVGKLPNKGVIKNLFIIITGINPILRVLNNLVLASRELTVTKLNALASIVENFGRLLTTIQVLLKQGANLNIRQLLKLTAFNKAFLPVIEILSRIVVALTSFDGKGLGNVAKVFEGIDAMVQGIAKVITSMKGIGFIGAALQNLIVILPLFDAIQTILRILLRFNPSELNAVGRIFFGLGQSFTAIASILGKIRDLKLGDLVASIGIMVFINRLFKQIKGFIADSTEFSAARLDGVGQIFRGIGQVFIGLGDSLRALQKNSESGFFKGLIKTIKDFSLLLIFLKPLFRTVKSILSEVVDVPPSVVASIGQIFSSLGGITRALAQFSRDASRITSIRELIILVLAMRGVFGALGGVIGSILKASKKADSVPIGPIKDLLDTILEVIRVFSRLSGDKSFKKNDLKLIEDTFKILPKVFNQFKIKKGTEQSLKSFAELLRIVTSDIDTSGIGSLDKLIDSLSRTKEIDVKTSGLGQLGIELKEFFDSFKNVSAEKIDATARALKGVGSASKIATNSTERLTSANKDLGGSFEEALRSERVREKVLGTLGEAFSTAASKAKNFLQNVSAPGLINNGITKLRELGDAVKNVGDELRDAGEEIREFGSELIENFGIGNLFGSEQFQGAIEFDKVGTQLKVFGNLNDEARAQAEEFAFELGRQYPISANEALLATLDLLKAGQSLEDIRFALPSIADLTALSDEGSLEDISSAVIQVVSQFDEFRDGVAGSFENTSVAADILSAAADGSISSVESLAEGLVKVGPIANSFGFGLEETAAALALFSNAGLDGAEAGTQLKSLLNNLQTSTAQNTLRDLNIDVADAAGNFLSLNDIIGNINTALNETSTVTFTPTSPLGPEAQSRYDAATQAAARASRQLALYRDGLTGGALDQEKANKKVAEYEQILSNANAVIAEVTGSQEEADAVTREITRTQEENAKTVKDLAGSYGSVGLQILLSSGEDGLQGFIDQMNDVLPASERARLLLDNLAGDVTQLEGSVSTAMTVALLPLINEFFRPLVQIARFVVDGFLNMDRSVLEFMGTAIGLTSVALTLAGAFFVVFGSLLQVGGIIFTVIGTFLNFSAVIGIVTGGLAALVTGFVAIVAVLGVFVPLIVGATAIFKALFQIFSKDLGGASTSATAFFRELGSTISDILSPLGAFFNFIRALVGGPGGGQLGILESVGGLVASVFDKMSNSLNTGFIARLKDGASAISSVFNFLSSEGGEAALAGYRKEIEQLGPTLGNLGSLVNTVGLKDAAIIIGNQLNDIAGNLVVKFANLAQNIFGSNLISDSLKQVFEGQGFIQGVEEGFSTLVDSLINAALANRGSIKEAFVSVMKFFFSPIKAVGFFADLFGIKPLQNFVSEFNNIFETVIGGAFDFVFNLLAGQSFGDAFINAFGDGAQPLLDFLTELGTAAENIGSIVSLIFENFFGRFVDDGEDVSIINVITGIIEKLTEGLSLLNDLILSPLAEGDVAGAFANIGTLIAEGFFNIVSTFTGLLDGVDIFGIFTGIATSIVNLFATAFKNAIVTLGDILDIDVSSIITTIESTLQANADVLNSEGTGAGSFFATVSNTIVGLFVAAIQTAFAGLGAALGIDFDLSGLLGILDTTFDANLTAANEGGALGAFSTVANTVLGLFTSAISAAFSAIGAFTGIDVSGIQTELETKLGDVLATIQSIFFGEEGGASIFEDIATIANTVADAISAILDAFSGEDNGESTTSALEGIVKFLGNLAGLALDTIQAPLIIIREFVSFLADQDAAQLAQIGVGIASIGTGVAVFAGISAVGGVTALLPAITGAIVGLGTAPFATIVSGLLGIKAAFSAFASSLIGKFAGVVAIAVIIKSIADNIEIFKESLQDFADGNYGEAFTTFLDGIGSAITDIGLTTLFDLLGFDTVFGQSREEIVETISQVEGLFSLIGVAFSLFIETSLIEPIRKFIDVDIADIINEVRKLTEIVSDVEGSGQLLADEAFVQSLFAADDLNIDALAGFINNDQTSEFIKEEIRILGRKAGPELAAQLAETLNGASTEDLIKWGEIIDTTGIFPDVAAAILNSGGDLGPVIDGIFAAGGEVSPEAVQQFSAVIQKHILDNGLNFDTFESDLGILEAIRDSIIKNEGDTTAIDEAIEYIRSRFEASLVASGDDTLEVEQDVEIVPGEVTITEEDGVIPIPPLTKDLDPVEVEVPMSFLPQPTPRADGDSPVIVEGGEVTLVPETVTVDTSEADTSDGAVFEEFSAETLTSPEELEELNLQLEETNSQLSNIELAFGLLETSAPLAVSALASIQETFTLADGAATQFYNTLITNSLLALGANALAFAVINGNITNMGNESLLAGSKYGQFTGGAGQQTTILAQIILRETQRMTGGFQSLNLAVKELTANLRDAIDQATKAAGAVTGINGVNPEGGGTPGRAIGGITLRGGRYEITERGESEVYEENGKTFLLASGAGRVLTMAQAFPDLASSRASQFGSQAMNPSSGVTNINSSTTISEGDIIINVTEPGASAADIASEVQIVLNERERRGGAENVSVREKLRTNHR